MEKVKYFDNFISELILEQINHGELPFRLTERLIKLLNNIDHKLSDKLLEDNVDDKSSKFTLVDYDDDDIDMFTFATSTKILDYIKLRKIEFEKEDDEIELFDELIDDKNNKIWKENRAKIKIGKFINKLYPNTYINAGKPGEDIESFVNAVKAERTKSLGNFKIVEGQDIVKYYNIVNYEKGGQGSTLWGSCMATKECQPYIGFYPLNNIKLVVLMSSQGDTIRGRALLWDIDEMDGEKVNRKFMDRIYIIKQHDIQKFTDLAERNGWLYKKSQDMWDSTYIVDTKDGSSERRSMVVHNIKEYKAYPYMDTMKYFNLSEGYLTNDNRLDYDATLESPDGGYDYDRTDWIYDPDSDKLVDSQEMIWSDEEERYLNPDHSVHSEYLDEWASKEYAEEHWAYSEPEDDWIPKYDAVYIKSIKSYVSEDYAEDNYIQCGKDGEWYHDDEGVPSEQWGIVPFGKVVFVITDDYEESIELYDSISIKSHNLDLDLGNGVDARWKGDKTYFTVHNIKKDKDYHLDMILKGSDFAKQIKKGVI